MTTITAAAGGGNWSATTTWTGGVVPTASDDVILASTSGNVVIDTTTCVCRSLDCQGSGNYGGILSASASTNKVSVGTSTANGTLALRFSSTMTWTPFSAAAVNLFFVSTSATQLGITTGGLLMASVTFNSAGSWLLLDTWTPLGTGSAINHLAGGLDSNNLPHTWGSMACTGNSNRVLSLGTSAITITSIATATVWNVSGLNHTVNASSSSISLTSTSAANKVFAGGGHTYGALSITPGGTGTTTITGANSFSSITHTGTKSLIFTNGVITTVRSAAGWLVNGSSGALAVVTSDSAGVPFTLSITDNSRLVSCDFISLKDCTASGSTPFYAGQHSTLVSGNTNWNATSPQTFSLSASSVSSASATVTTSSSTPIPLDTASSTSSTSGLGLSVATQIPLDTASSASSSALSGLSTATQVPLTSSSSVSGASLSLQAQTSVPLAGAASTSASTLSLSTGARMSLAGASSSSSSSLNLQAPLGPLQLSTAVSSSSSAIAVSIPITLALNPTSSVSYAYLRWFWPDRPGSIGYTGPGYIGLPVRPGYIGSSNPGYVA